MHPDGRSWACTGQSAKVGFYTDLADIAETLDVDLENTGAEHQDDEDQDDKTSQSLGKLVKVIETGRGKFGMDLKYVSRIAIAPFICEILIWPFPPLEPGRQVTGTGRRDRSCHDH